MRMHKTTGRAQGGGRRGVQRWERSPNILTEIGGNSNADAVIGCRIRPRNIIVRRMTDSEQKQWFFYLARCSDGSLYSGITVDPEKRMQMHNAGKGARYTRSRLPVTMVYSEPQPDQSSALKREAVVRKWSRKKKEELVAGGDLR
jgi:predicted GIY-YIG superfamily endonuclease